MGKKSGIAAYSFFIFLQAEKVIFENDKMTI